MRDAHTHVRTRGVAVRTKGVDSRVRTRGAAMRARGAHTRVRTGGGGANKRARFFIFASHAPACME